MGRAGDGATKRKVEPPSNTIPREQVAVNLAASAGVGSGAFLGVRRPQPAVETWRGLSERTRPSRSRVVLDRAQEVAGSTWLAPFGDRNPACFAGHDDFDRPHDRSRPSRPTPAEPASAALSRAAVLCGRG
jgi:hypothetical protein